MPNLGATGVVQFNDSNGAASALSMPQLELKPQPTTRFLLVGCDSHPRGLRSSGVSAESRPSTRFLRLPSDLTHTIPANPALHALNQDENNPRSVCYASIATALSAESRTRIQSPTSVYSVSPHSRTHTRSQERTSSFRETSPPNCP